MFRWYLWRTEGMDHYEAEAWLRTMLLCSPFGHSVKTRHAFDHLFDEIAAYRVENYDSSTRFRTTVVENLCRVSEEGSVAA
jgi:hypothetical protein